jgi:hypothetical protein
MHTEIFVGKPLGKQQTNVLRKSGKVILKCILQNGYEEVNWNEPVQVCVQ